MSDATGPGHSIVDGVIKSISPSQIATFDTDQFGGCQRRWYFEKKLGRKSPETKNQAVGTLCHSQYEHYLSTGEDVLGKIARAAKWLLPAPGGDLRIEWGLNNKPRPPNDAVTGKAVNWYPPEDSLVRAAGIPLIGFGDIFNFRGEYVSPDGSLLRDPADTVEYIDHKTTSNFKYAKTAEQLIETAQMPGYGEFLRRLVPGLKYVRLSHIYALTEGAPHARKVTALVPVDVIQKRWTEIEKVVEGMPQVAAAKRVEEVPGHEPSCSAYRGCPHRSVCPMKVSNAITRLRMSFIKKTMAAGAVAAQTVPAVPAAPAAAAAAIPPPPPPAATERKMVIKDEPTVPQPPQTAAVALPAVTYACQAVAGQPYVVGEVNTIAIGPTNGKFQFIPTVGGEPLLLNPIDTIVPGAIPAHASAGLVPPPAVQPAVASSAVGAAIADAAPPAKRGRPPKALGPCAACGTELTKENASTKDGKSTHIGCAAAATVASATAVAAAAPDLTFGLHLYVNCMPGELAGVKMLDGYVARMAEDLSKKFDVIDPRISNSNDDPNAFGKWKGILAAMVKDAPPAPGAYIALTTGDELTAATVAALTPLCATVVRGVR